MEFDPRLGVLLDQRPDAARLRTGQVVADDAAGREVHRKLLVHGIAALAPRRGQEAALAVLVHRDAAFKQPRRAGMIERRTRPEDAHLAIDPLVRDAVVVRDAAARGL